jgi:hypothetical protein
MENNYFTQDFAVPAHQANPQAEAAVMRKSRAPIVLTMVCMFLAGAVAAALLFFFTGANSSYEQAERNSINSFATGLSSLFSEVPDTVSGTGSITITPSRGIGDIPGMSWFAEIGDIVFNYDTAIQGSDIYMLLGLDALGINASMQIWQLGQEMLMHFPGISDYYILTDFMGDMMSMSTMPQFSDFDEELLLEELEVIGNALLDRYFELTKGIEASGREDVTVGNITKNCDVYEIIIDELFALELAVVALDKFLDSEELMKLGEALYELTVGDYYRWQGVMSFLHFVEDLYFDAFDKLDRIYEEGTSGDVVTMRVYINGRDVIRRDIVAENDFTFSFASVKEKSGEYAQSLSITVTNSDWRGNTYTDTMTFENIGVNGNNGNSGKIRFSYEDRWESFSFEITYEDFMVYDNGTFSGAINLSIPSGNFNIHFNITATAEGGSQTIVCLVSIKVGETLTVTNALKIEIVFEFRETGSITRPDNNARNTINSYDWRAMQDFEDDLYDWLLSLNIDLLEDFLMWNMASSSNYCYDCWTYHERWEGCYDWDNHCYECWDYECDSSCPPRCDNCWEFDCNGSCPPLCYECWTFHETYEDCYDWCSDDEWCRCDKCYELRDPCTAGELRCFCVKCYSWDNDNFNWDNDIDDYYAWHYAVYGY